MPIPLASRLERWRASGSAVTSRDAIKAIQHSLRLLRRTSLRHGGELSDHDAAYLLLLLTCLRGGELLRAKPPRVEAAADQVARVKERLANLEPNDDTEEATEPDACSSLAARYVQLLAGAVVAMRAH
eukprot:5150005-Prymnesium_polylepis.1